MITINRIHEVFAEETRGRGGAWVRDGVQRTVSRLLAEAAPTELRDALHQQYGDDKARLIAAEDELEMAREKIHALQADLLDARTVAVQLREEMRKSNRGSLRAALRTKLGM